MDLVTKDYNTRIDELYYNMFGDEYIDTIDELNEILTSGDNSSINEILGDIVDDVENIIDDNMELISTNNNGINVISINETSISSSINTTNNSIIENIDINNNKEDEVLLKSRFSDSYENLEK
jgi:hypothetical protein